MSYDTKCHDLAHAFLADTDTQDINSEANTHELAQRIQDTIEEFIEEKKADA